MDLPKLDAFPTLPGVYLMKNRNGAIIYVGKAKNLRQRIKQYFTPGGDARMIIPFLIANVTDIDTLVVTSEKEALLLENTLIKQHRPKYNALLKDDKSYIALKVNHKHPWPMVQLVRYKGKPEPDGLYFGPYTSAQAARSTLDLIQRVFPLRECSDQELVRRTRPCILYDMKRCIAPCVNKCTKEEYFAYVEKMIKFLRGQDKEILKELYEEMERHAELLEFEKADLVLKKVREIERTLEGQRVDKPLGGDADVLGIYRQGAEVILVLLFIRGGKLLGSRHYNFANIAEDDAELLSTFLLQHYDKESDLPEEVLLPFDLEEAETIAEILSASKSRKTRVYCPQRGDKRALVDIAFVNAETTFTKEKDLRAIRERILFEMQEKLHLNQYPKRIECYDNSNISGSEPVSALVVFVDGEKEKSRYRKYKVKTVTTPDDYSTMYEILMRRYTRAKEENDLPDLVIVDGGKGHLNVAAKVFAELNIVSVDLIALAKEEGRHDKGATADQVFLQGVRDPVMLKRNSPILFLLQQIRDEAHRFALTFHRQRRSKQMLRTELLNIPGIGPSKSKLLLRHFGSLQRIREASREELAQVKGISKTNVEAILAFLKRSAE